jgi:hypothetical protein
MALAAIDLSQSPFSGFLYPLPIFPGTHHTKFPCVPIRFVSYQVVQPRLIPPNPQSFTCVAALPSDNRSAPGDRRSRLCRRALLPPEGDFQGPSHARLRHQGFKSLTRIFDNGQVPIVHVNDISLLLKPESLEAFTPHRLSNPIHRLFTPSQPTPS